MQISHVTLMKNLPSDLEGKKHVYQEGQSKGDDPRMWSFARILRSFSSFIQLPRDTLQYIDEVSGRKSDESAHVRKTEFIVPKNIDPNLQD